MRASLLIMIFCAIVGCSDDVQEPEIPICYIDHHDPGCVTLEFYTLTDGMIISRANVKMKLPTAKFAQAAAIGSREIVVNRPLSAC